MSPLGRPIQPPRTLFAQWMADLALTNESAARALGMSRSRVNDLRMGTAYVAGRRAEPDRRTLLAMAALRAGLAPYGQD